MNFFSSGPFSDVAIYVPSCLAYFFGAGSFKEFKANLIISNTNILKTSYCHMKKLLEFINFIKNSIRTDSEKKHKLCRVYSPDK